MGMHSFLPDDKINEIDSKIPKLNTWFEYNVLGTSVNDSLNDTNIHVALVCLDDARNRFSFIYTALFEAQAKTIWFLKMSPNAPDETQAIAAGKFYLDYVTLLMYAAGEDIAFFIVHYFNIDITEYIKDTHVLKILDEKGISSNAGKVGLYLSREMKGYEVTRIISRLHKDPNWKKSLKYRNKWVHEKPPIISGLGYEFLREKFRTTTGHDGVIKIEIIGGEPQYSIDQLLNITLKATQALATALSDIVKMVSSDNQK